MSTQITGSMALQHLPLYAQNQGSPDAHTSASTEYSSAQQMHGAGRARPRPARPGNDWHRPQPTRPDYGWDRPQPTRPDHGWDRPQPTRPENGWHRPQPTRPEHSWDRPQPTRPEHGWDRPQPTRPEHSWDRPQPEGRSLINNGMFPYAEPDFEHVDRGYHA